MIPSRLLLGIVLISFAAATAAKPIITQYWPSYNYVAEPLSDFPWYSTDIGYYFVVVTTAAGFNEVAENLPNVADFAPAAHANGKKAIFSIGGWDGGLYFSGQVNTTAGRTRLATQLHTFATKYAFDGVDIDWEYPGSQGIGCNEISPNDSANFLLFLKQLRTTFGATAILTAAVGTNTFVGPDGNPLASVASYAKYLSYVNLMTYDIGGIWDPHTDPNSPLRTCLADSSATAAVGAWVAAGFPASQILLGIPSYSHSFTTLSSTLQATEVLGYKSYLYQKMSSITPKGDHTDVYVPATDLDVCGNTQTGYDGQWLYKNLIADGVLSSDGSTGLNGYARTWDGCTGTPFLFNSKSREFISYDDAESAGYKAALAKADGLAGVMVFDSTGFNTQVYQSIQTNLGLATTAPPAKRSFEIIARNEHAKTPSLSSRIARRRAHRH